jgi:magnesium chelatase subunit I
MPVKMRPRTVRELRDSGYRVKSVREEMRQNLVGKLKGNEPLFPKIVGYQDSVIPQIENAVLAGQDLILLGERGQAKSRIIRSLTTLLDNEIPAIEGCPINDNPFDPICRSCRDKSEEMGDTLGIAWLPREMRFSEKLATPDISIADLIGEVDPIRVAEGRYLSDELTIHYGLVPRTNRGIFAINELPDLPERIQVGLFNLLEERDIQIKGYRIRLPLDVYIVASANPEDYTNRGRIITPLKDRYGAQVRTHYPRTTEEEIEIVEQEHSRLGEMDSTIAVPQYMKEIIAEITALARKSPDINQRSGVSVRVSIANYETVASNALRRALRNDEDLAVPRISDLAYIFASTAGKVELESFEEGRESRVIEDITKKAVLNVFANYFNICDFDSVVERFEGGLEVETGSEVPSADYLGVMKELVGLAKLLKPLKIRRSPEQIAASIEFVLEGLHLNRRLNRDRVEGRSRYRS